MKYLYCILLLAFLSLTSCDLQTPPRDIPPPKPDVAEIAIGYARDIVSDPSNWKGNSILYTKLAEAAQDLGILKSPQFQKFESSVNKLITFGTQWVSNVDEGSASKLKNDLTHLTSSTEARVELQTIGQPAIQQSVGSGKYKTDSSEDSKRTQAEAEHAIFTTVNGLRAAQADEFGKIFQESQSAFLDLRALLLTKVKSPPIPIAP